MSARQISLTSAALLALVAVIRPACAEPIDRFFAIVQESETRNPATVGPAGVDLPVKKLTVSTAPPSGTLPRDQAKKIFERAGASQQGWGQSRGWTGISYAWEAPMLAHQPLRFEDENLERYGHHAGVLQPAVSTVKFFGRLPVLPYLMGATPHRECRYTLGYYRPGDCAPHYFSRPRLSWRGALNQAAATTGAVFVIP